MASMAIALQRRLRGCSNVQTLGVFPNFSDYSPKHQQLIRQASVIYYPSNFYADIIESMGKRAFPNAVTYAFAQDKIRQTALFRLLEIPHPKTRVYYGKRQQKSILQNFSLPLVAKIARGSGRGAGVFLVSTAQELESYCQQVHAAYIQQYIPMEKDIRVVVIGGQPVLSYWRIPPEGQFLTNISQGGAISFEDIPETAVKLAVHTAKKCRFDDVGIDVCMANGSALVLEANMKYGTQGFKQAGIDFYKLMESLITHGKI